MYQDNGLSPDSPQHKEALTTPIVATGQIVPGKQLADSVEDAAVIDEKNSKDLVIAKRFHALFSGMERAHGSYLNINWDEARSDGKFKGDAVTRREPVTDDLWQRHLDGKYGIGVIPIRDDSRCVFAAIDVDVYADLDLGRVAFDVAKMGLPLIVCRSKSGGAHIYLFMKEPVPAGKVQERLREIAATLAFGTAELFPKQTSIDSDRDLGSWINCPYQNAAETNRYAVMPTGDAMTAEEFLTAAEAARVGPEWFNTPLSVPSAPVATASVKGPKSKKRAFILPDQIVLGQQETTMTAFAGTLRRAGVDRDSILAALKVENLKRCVPVMLDKDLERIAGSIGKREPGAELEDGLIQKMAGAIIGADAFARDAGGLLYHFEEGVYRPTGRRVIERRVKQLCEQQAPKSWTPELATRVEAWISVDCPELWERPPLDVLNCRNGLLNVETRTLVPHSSDHLSAVQINASFDPDARCPDIDRFVAEVFPDDTRHLPAEVTAWLMLPDTSIQKAVLLLGEGANGKSVWLNLLITFLGKENVSTLSLHKLESDKFAVARLVGKLANCGLDLPTKMLAGTSMFKNLTGGDVVSAERKFETSFEFRPFVRLLFSANSSPRSDDATHGFFRRWLCIPFNRTFDETDAATIPRAVLDARLSQPGELSGLLNRALDALPVIRKGRFTESASTRAALDEFRRTTDPLGVWLDANVIERPDAVVAKDRLRSMYGQVCQEAGRPIMGDVQFTAALKRLRPRVEPARRRVNRELTQVYVGLGLVTQDPVPDSMF